MTGTDWNAVIGERIDQMIRLDVPARGVIDTLFPLARAKQGRPMCMAAAALLKERVRKGNVVLIATGWLDRPHISATIAESDGPPGAAALARALHRGLRAVPVILVEDCLVEGMTRVMQAAGFRVLPPAEAVASEGSRAPLHGAAVLGFPAEIAAAEERARTLIDTLAPAAVVTIEKGGMNDRGFIHTGRGDDTSGPLAKVDALVREAIARGIATIGIGDGGNEIGMGVIEREIREHIPYGAKAREEGKGGIAPSTVTDVLVAASISNWGAYGVAACLAALLGRLDVFHDAAVEERILSETANASFIDGITGFVDPGADGLPSPVHQAFVTVMGEVVRQALGRRAG